MSNAIIERLKKEAMIEHQFDLRFNPDKFAELLVKECAKVLDARDPDFNAYSRSVLSQHFGIKL